MLHPNTVQNGNANRGARETSRTGNDEGPRLTPGAFVVPVREVSRALRFALPF